MKLLDKMINAKTTAVRELRSLAHTVLRGNTKMFSEAKGSPYHWFKTKSEEVSEYKENWLEDFRSFEAALGLLQASGCLEWTVLDMAELGRRMLIEIATIDNLYKALVWRRANVIELQRDARAGQLKMKHSLAMQLQKLAKPWIENGANKKIMLILRTIGACWVCCFFVTPVSLKIFKTVMLAT